MYKEKDYKKETSSQSAKHTKEDLKAMQELSLEQKIKITQTRIIEWYQQNEGKVYVSFSGGKDSTVLLDLVRRIYPDVPAVYIDTGLEYPELREFVKQIENVVWLKPKLTFRQVIEKYGYPVISKEQSAFISEYRRTRSEKLKSIRMFGNKYGLGKISEKWKYLINAPFLIDDRCCDVMKKAPAKKFEHDSGLKPIIATMACESNQRKSNWIMYGCNAFDAKRPTSRPISFWTEQDILEYLVRFNIPYAPVYGKIVMDENKVLHTTKCDRTGCVFCAFGCHLEKEPNRFQRLKQTHPKLWSYCMRPWDQGGLGMRQILEYINVKVE